jgi:hypothetical protein
MWSSVMTWAEARTHRVSRVLLAHAMKLAFEKYFLWKTRHGYISLP